MTAGNLQGRPMHERTLELAAAAIDFDLSAAEVGELEAHLVACSTCARRAAAMRSDATRLGGPLSVLPSSRVDDAVYLAISGQHRRSARIPILVAAALLLIALLGAVAAGSYLLRTWQTLPISVVPLPSPTGPIGLISPRPEPSPSPVTSAVPSVSDITPPIATIPDPAGATGLTWALAHTDTNTNGDTIVHGPAGWIHVLTGGGQAGSTLRSLLSSDLRTWSEVTPAKVRIGCVSLAASRSAYVSSCAGLMRSVDGRAWVNVEAPPISDGTFKGDAKAFYSDGATFIATTGSYPSSDGIWSSSDGARWVKIHLPNAPRVIIDAVVGRASGGYLIAGRVAETEAEFGPSSSTGHDYSGRQGLWESDDGVTWRSMPLGDVFRGARITGLAADGPGGGILAVGHIGGYIEADSAFPQTALWRSRDGVTWAHLTGSAFDIRESNIGDARVVALFDRWLVFASRRPAGTSAPTATTVIGVVAGSENGTTWWSSDPIRGSGLPSDSIQALVVDEGRLVVLDNVRIDSGTIDPSARIWVSP